MKLADTRRGTAKDSLLKASSLAPYCLLEHLNTLQTRACNKQSHLFHWCLCPLRGQSRSPWGKAWKGCPPSHVRPSLFVALPHPQTHDTPSDTVGRWLKLKKLLLFVPCLAHQSGQTNPSSVQTSAWLQCFTDDYLLELKCRFEWWGRDEVCAKKLKHQHKAMECTLDTYVRRQGNFYWDQSAMIPPVAHPKSGWSARPDQWGFSKEWSVRGVS